MMLGIRYRLCGRSFGCGCYAWGWVGLGFGEEVAIDFGWVCDVIVGRGWFSVQRKVGQRKQDWSW